MPSQSETRRRKKQKSHVPAEVPETQHTVLTTVKPYLYTALRQLHIALLGLLCAASLTHTTATVTLFFGTSGAMLIALVRVFMSILRTPDRTPIPLRPVYYADGTVVTPPTLTVHDHDNKIATYFASELPALAVATAWLYIWAQLRPVVLVYALYVAYRLAYQPLFRIHLWKEPYRPEFERPFGGVPLFRAEDRAGSVQVVEGKTAYEEAMRRAGGKLVVVDFSATWCGPCRAAAPLFKQLAEEHQEAAVFLSVDVDHSQDVAAKEDISSIPTFIFFREGDRLEMMRGAFPDKLREALQRHLSA